MKAPYFRRFSQRGAVFITLCTGLLLPTMWLTGCSGGSGGSGISLGSGLPTGGGGGPDGGGNGGGGGGGSTAATPTPVPACGGGTFSASFTGVAGANADTTTFNATQVRGSAATASFTLTATLCNPPATGNRTVTVKVNQALVAGKSYSLTTGSAGSNFLQYIESTTVGDQTVEKSWTATAATLTVQAVTGQTVTFRIQNANLAPDPDFFTSNAAGSFNLSVNGSATAFSGL